MSMQFARGSGDSDSYQYDPVGRLTSWNRVTTGAPGDATLETYEYDRIGNRTDHHIVETENSFPSYTSHRTYQFDYTGSHSWKNHLHAVTDGLHMSDVMTYNSNGAMITRQTLDTNLAHTIVRERLETYAYNALGLIEKFTLRSQQGKVSADDNCDLDASYAPLNEWRYRFSPMAEREQKRQYVNFNDSNALAWTYYMLGADAGQLSTWHGIEGDHCAQTNTVWLWPVERNGYGPAHTRIIVRQDGSREFVIADHLGSTRVVVNDAKERLEEYDYRPFGEPIAHAGSAARTDYIGRETDTESDLGSYGLRMYSSEYGRFTSSDPLWMKYMPLTPYNYCAGNPLLFRDPTGTEIWIKTDDDGKQVYVRFDGVNLVGEDGKIYEPKEERLKELLGVLRKLMETGERNVIAMMNYLLKPDVPTTLIEVTSLNDGSETRPLNDPTEAYNNCPTEAQVVWDQDGDEAQGQNNTMLVVWHELVHAWHLVTGTRNNDGGNEIQGVVGENMLRHNLGLPMRLDYGLIKFEWKQVVPWWVPK